MTCVKCNIQGVDHCTQFNNRVANYFSHIKSRTRDCEITCHFIDHHYDTWKASYLENEEFSVQEIKLEHPLRSKKELENRLIEFEGYWQHRLNTIAPYGMNVKDEMKKLFIEENKLHYNFGFICLS